MRNPLYVFAVSVLLACTPAHGSPVVLHVTLSAASKEPASGRLLIFAKPLREAQLAVHGGAVTKVDWDPLDIRGTTVAAQDVRGLAPGSTVTVDADVQTFPTPFSALKQGRYALQAALISDASTSYFDRGPGDRTSQVIEADLPGASQSLVLGPPLPEEDPWHPAAAPPEVLTKLAAARPDITALDFNSPLLSRFDGRLIHMRGWILTLPGYAAGSGRYPTVYWTHGFGATNTMILTYAATIRAEMASGALPSMIWVFLDEELPTGTHEFADGVNNGPWGEALTTELIPDLERHWRIDARPGARFVTGKSSGGWAALWLQVRYPHYFGGAWPVAPDPADFHDFTGVDLYAPGANYYHHPDGTPYELIRDHGHLVTTLEDFARLEAVMRPYGGQIGSFDWAFSPRGVEGRPQPLFDRATGAVDPLVAAYWGDHYDIARIVERNWTALRPDLDGKIHLAVGTADTFHLDGPARRLESVFRKLGAHEEFHFLPGRTHFDVYQIGTDKQGLARLIAWEMYVTARPDVTLPADLPKLVAEHG